MTNAGVEDIDLPLIGLTPPSDQRNRYRNVHVIPDQGAAYSYNILLPADWKLVQLPSAPVSTTFTGLSLFSPFDPPIPPVILSIGTRLSTNIPTVAENVIQSCQVEGIRLVRMRPQRYAVGNVVEALLIQDSPIGPFKVRMAMFEDGGRLFALSGMAPEALYAEMVRDLSLAMVSFVLSLPQGSTMPLAPI